MNSAWPRRVSLIIAGGLPAIPSPTICVLSGTVPAVAGLSCRFRLRLLPADSPAHADRIEFTCLFEFTCLCLSRPCHGLVVLVPLLSTPHYCDAVTVRYRTVLHRTGADFHRSIFLPFQAHWQWSRCGHSGLSRRSAAKAEAQPSVSGARELFREPNVFQPSRAPAHAPAIGLRRVHRRFGPCPLRLRGFQSPRPACALVERPFFRISAFCFLFSAFRRLVSALAHLA